jgi:hypothetical protein
VALLFAILGCDDPPPTIPHGLPNEAADQMCVVCHTCGNDGSSLETAPLIDQQHDVCNSCHLPDGTVVHNAGDSCEWSMDCQAVPPTINCNDCHTVEYVNDLCEACHHLP